MANKEIDKAFLLPQRPPGQEANRQGNGAGQQHPVVIDNETAEGATGVTERFSYWIEEWHLSSCSARERTSLTLFSNQGYSYKALTSFTSAGLFICLHPHSEHCYLVASRFLQIEQASVGA